MRRILRHPLHLRRVALVGALIAAIAAALCVSPASAATQTASGSFTETPETITDAQFSGGNEIYELTRDAIFTGTYSGVGHVVERIVIHADGSFSLNMTIEFSGLACGQPAELTFRVGGQGSFVTNDIAGTYSMLGPAGVGKGQGTFSAVPGVGGTYAGQAHCG